MFKSKYSTVLTICLIVLVIAIIGVAIVLSVKLYNNYKEEKERSKAIAEFEHEVYEEKIENNKEEEEEFEELVIPTFEDNDNEEQNTQKTSSRPKTKMYKNYPMAGYIEIPKTKVKYPVLLDISPAALEVAVGISYPNNPKLNQPGNVVIIGHNYKNGKFFADNKKLVVGDKIKITDLNGTTLTYTIYEMMTISDSDTEFITRDRGENIEISLSTCTDDGKARLVVLARAK